ncbi:tektin-4-like [Octopus sinensis]|uniref:Tektin n=1 Tax=Octopus sinensis TaxID=2607531 RepID=A0A6P7U2G8_9MOLL|nr:tektin-4-like [Octopus sinensis]XP_029656680.1 tektin-4-like [Octopus sinensis]
MSAIYESTYGLSSNEEIGCGLIDCTKNCGRPSYSIKEWQCENNNNFNNSLTARCEGEKQCYDTKTKQNFYNNKIVDSINAVDTSFRERLRDIDFWKQELKKSLQTNIKETGDLRGQRDRLRLALLSMDLPTQINMDNCNCKRMKNTSEIFDDQVEELLLKVWLGTNGKECCLLNSSKQIIGKTLDDCESQIT